MKSISEGMALFVDDVILARRLAHIPMTLEAGWRHKRIAGAQQVFAAIIAGYDDFSCQQSAELVLGEDHPPLAHGAFPDAGAETSICAGVVIPGSLLGITAHDALRRRTPLLRLRRRAFQIDDHAAPFATGRRGTISRA